ncbi:type IV conjugative transfer system protein TraE [Arsenophonus sp.]|uniref:type IV conjugative transfer system protein TraE n=1 Tax=Arsenophonus sp. TaxID=1872640 RepID=UPI0028548FF4|nr:type IV conjugative transfer system protein TraE [Arsenophonus sp.]MDR5610298.1 type IV conjugative transfer system protein TraE [Arsenophonus sp.]MDR5614120.1 type IV conjugative transfer system protein TraE [Arsenophonus sp.]
MDYQLRKSSQKQLAIGVVTCVVITILSLGICYRLLMQNRELTAQLLNNRQTIVTPMVDHEGFSFYGTRGDARYLRLMALSLLNLRLNVSAQTIKDSHDLLLAYSDTHLREKLITVLAEERQRMAINEASSTFYLKEVKVSPDTGVVDITGELHFFYGIKAVEPVDKHYRLRLETRDGALKLTDFVELPA